MKKLLITGDIDAALVESLDYQLCHISAPDSDEQIMAQLCDSHYYIIGGPEHCSAAYLACAKNLELVIVLGTGTSSFIDLEAAKRHGVTVMNTPGLNANTVAQFAFATLLLRSARFHLSWQKMQAGQWYQAPYQNIGDLNIGLVGMGNINKSLLSIIRQHNDKPIQYFATGPKPQLEHSQQLTFTPLQTLFAQCDVVVVSLTYNPSSAALINQQILENANPNLDLLCFSSPYVICPKALKTALTEQTIRSAYMDGYYHEWLDNQGAANDEFGLLALAPQVFMATTHIAAQTHSAIAALMGKAIENIEQFERG